MNYGIMKTGDLRKIAAREAIEGGDTMSRKDLVRAVAEKMKGREEPEEVLSEGGEAPEKEETRTVPEKEEVVIDEKKEVEQIPSVGTLGIKGERTSAGSKADRMKAWLETQPKVRIMIPRQGKEKMGTTESVVLNGYRLNIVKGVYVLVPKPVADVIMKSQNQTEDALNAPKREDGSSRRIDQENLPSELKE